MAFSSVNPCRKTRTVQQPQPDDPNLNTAESMVKNAHRTSHLDLTDDTLASVSPRRLLVGVATGRCSPLATSVRLSWTCKARTVLAYCGLGLS